MTDKMTLAAARVEALEVRRLYEILEQRSNGRTWSSQELMIGFSSDVGQIGRLLLAHDGTWPIGGDVGAELEHKLAEALWWVFVLAERLDIDIDQAFAETMTAIHTGLEKTITRTAPRSGPRRAPETP